MVLRFLSHLNVIKMAWKKTRALNVQELVGFQLDLRESVHAFKGSIFEVLYVTVRERQSCNKSEMAEGSTPGKDRKVDVSFMITCYHKKVDMDVCRRSCRMKTMLQSTNEIETGYPD